MKLRILLGLLFMVGFVRAEEVELNPGHPERYTVVRGDTLWDIAGKFLAKPWQWPEIWRDNPHIANPHWIYPGDELELAIVDGSPRLQVARRPAQVSAVQGRPAEERLSPTIRVEPLEQAIPTIPMNAIQQFLVQPRVVGVGVMENAPYVLAFADEHVSGGAGYRMYVRGLPESPPATGYMIFRGGKPYMDPETGAILGYEALYVGDAEILAGGDPSTMRITKSAREVIIGDRILPVEAEKVQMRYQPHAPAHPVSGHIIAVVDGVSQIAQYQVVIIDRGTADGIDTGHVLQIRQSGRDFLNIYQGQRGVRDVIGPRPGEIVPLSSEREGLLMVFRPFERVSFALVLYAARAIHLQDAVLNP